MNRTQQGVITLLKCAITGENSKLPEEFDLEAVYPELKKHSMDALLCEGAMHCGLSVRQPVMQTLFQRYAQELRRSEGQLRELQRIFAAFEENGIDYLPLKGSKMKLLYPKAELRYMSDADILIRVEQYGRIQGLMKNLGFQFQGESDHELKWTSPQLFLELHKRLIPTDEGEFWNCFGDGWELSQRQEGTRYRMSPEDEWLFLFTHVTKHFLYGGIGCRYIVDLWVHLRSNPQMDEAYLQEKLEALHLREFHDNIRTLISVWFEDAPSDQKTDILTDFIFDSGSWGTAKAKVVSLAVRDSRQLTGIRGKLAYFLRIAFPGVMMLREKYTVLKYAPWMLPVVWLYRPIYKLLFERKDVGAQQEKLSMVTTESMKGWHMFLEYAGLSYHHKD